MSEEALWFIVGVPTSAFLGFVVNLVWDRLWRHRLCPQLVAKTSAEGGGFIHVEVTNRRLVNDDYAPNPRPAWRCTGTVQALDRDGAELTTAFPARWSSHPTPQSVADAIAARTIDIYPHSPEIMPVLYKDEGDPECYLFTNESYLLPGGPTHQMMLIPARAFRLRVRIKHEFGVTEPFDIWIENDGSTLHARPMLPGEQSV